MEHLTFTSDLAAAPAAVWAHATSMAGIDHELRPWLSMRPPRRWADATLDDLPLGVPLGRAWILLGGVLPVEYDHLGLAAVDPGRSFDEDSSMLSLRRWTHRRVVSPVGHGSRVSDTVGFEPRAVVPTPLVRVVVSRLFEHRHRRLVGRFGGG